MGSFESFGIDIGGSLVHGDGTVRCTVRSVRSHGFTINNVLVSQSVIVMPRSYVAWSARTMEDVTTDSLQLLKVIYPTPEVVLIGCGEKVKDRLPADLVEHFRKSGIVLEATSTSSAAATFNVLSAEGRNVVAALLTLSPSEEDLEL